MASQCLEQARVCAPERALDPVLSMNSELDRVTNGRLINEAAIEAWLGRLQAAVSANDPCFWLLLARLTELAVVCAGRYADACEFTAAGDLLVNPRQIRVHFAGDKPSADKHRRGALSAQFNTARVPHHDFILWFRRSAAVEIVKTPLLKFFLEMLETSGVVAPGYLDKVRVRVDRIAETLGFLSSWQVTDAVDFQRRLGAASPETRRFVRSHLCNFSLNLFVALGRDVLSLCANGTTAGDYLVRTGPPLNADKLNRRYRHA